jgi:RIO kinase 1
MRIPKRLQPLVDDGLVDEVIRPLMSGKEASVLVVQSGGEIRCAKVYKEATNRNFKQRANYEEGRSVRNSRRARAMAKRSKFGKQELEESWQNTEVETIYKLTHAGVRVPRPHVFSDGVLIMELVVDAEGNAAPRLNDVSLSPTRAREYHAFMLTQVVKMLCAGLIHGDLSEYNVLLGADGPVVIDFPQTVDAAGNNNAKRMFLRDVGNLATYFGRFAPELTESQYGKEIWKLYERGELHQDVELTGFFEESQRLANVDSVMRDIEDAREDHERRFGRKVVEVAPSPARLKTVKAAAEKDQQKRTKKDGRSNPNARGGPTTEGTPEEQPKRKRRKQRKRPSDSNAETTPTQTQDGSPTQATTPSQDGAAKPSSSKRRRRRRRRKPTPQE